MMSPEDFATEALIELADGRDEVLVGLSAGSRKMGEALFGRMNGAGARSNATFGAWCKLLTWDSLVLYYLPLAGTPTA